MNLVYKCEWCNHTEPYNSDGLIRMKRHEFVCKHRVYHRHVVIDFKCAESIEVMINGRLVPCRLNMDGKRLDSVSFEYMENGSDIFVSVGPHSLKYYDFRLTF